MSTANASSLKLCKTIVQQLGDQSGLPTQFRDEIGVYDALVSSKNRRGYEREIQRVTDTLQGNPTPSSPFGIAQFAYRKPQCNATESDCADADVCTPSSTGEDHYGYVNLTIDKCAFRQFTVTTDQFNSVCYDRDQYLAEELRIQAQAVLRDINAKCKTAVSALMGAYADGDSSILTTKTVNLVNAQGGVNAPAMSIINNEFFKIGGSSNLIKVGGTYLNMYNGLLGVAGPNTSNGTDATKLAMDNGFIDHTLGCDMLAWEAGAIQFVEAFKNHSKNRIMFETHIKDTLRIDGVDFDYTMNFKPCSNGGSWTVVLSKSFGLFYIPTADYTCSPTGSNLKLKFNIGAGNIDATMLGLC